ASIGTAGLGAVGVVTVSSVRAVANRGARAGAVERLTALAVDRTGMRSSAHRGAGADFAGDVAGLAIARARAVAADAVHAVPVAALVVVFALGAVGLAAAPEVRRSSARKASRATCLSAASLIDAVEPRAAVGGDRTRSAGAHYDHADMAL